MSTFSKIRVGKKGYLAGTPKLILVSAAFDATSATAAILALPPTAIITGVGSIVGTLDEVADTIDVGTTDGGEDIKSELIAGVTTAIAPVANVTLADGNVYISVGATSTGTGTAQVVIEYFIPDTLAGVNQ